jgi:hypothetical protein
LQPEGETIRHQDMTVAAILAVAASLGAIPRRRRARHRAMSGAAFAQKGETVKIGGIDPLSGLGQRRPEPAQELPVPGREVQRRKNPAGVKFESASTTS